MAPQLSFVGPLGVDFLDENTPQLPFFEAGIASRYLSRVEEGLVEGLLMLQAAHPSQTARWKQESSTSLTRRCREVNRILRRLCIFKPCIPKICPLMADMASFLGDINKIASLD
jgi:hypothetical protein